MKKLAVVLLALALVLMSVGAIAEAMERLDRADISSIADVYEADARARALTGEILGRA